MFSRFFLSYKPPRKGAETFERLQMQALVLPDGRTAREIARMIWGGRPGVTPAYVGQNGGGAYLTLLRLLAEEGVPLLRVHCSCSRGSGNVEEDFCSSAFLCEGVDSFVGALERGELPYRSPASVARVSGAVATASVRHWMRLRESGDVSGEEVEKARLLAAQLSDEWAVAMATAAA